MNLRNLLRALWPLSGLLLPLAAGAQAAAADCVAIVDNDARLSCYDRLHRRPAQPAAVSAAPTSPIPPTSAAPALSARQASTLASRWDLDAAQGPSFAPRAYKPTYLLPATWTDHINRSPSSPAPGHTELVEQNLKAVEAKYQISLKARFSQDLAGSGLSLWGGYTQSSRWQVYNGAASRPFRETNYEPELMLVWPLKLPLFGWDLRLASLSLNHQSNGRALPLSRSWNRVIATLAAERGDWVAEFRPWVRITESHTDDDNPDIEDHVGRAELRLGRYTRDHALTLQLRHSLRSGSRSRGSAQLEWVFPLSEALHGYLQVFSGQGESLVDYNVRQTKLGLGITIAGWQ
jgi:phospholipase A1